MLHMSKEAFEFRAPWTYALIGSSFADHQPAEGRALYEKLFLPAHDDKEFLASVAVVKVYSNWGVKLPGFPKPNCREWTITRPFPLFFDVVGRTIPEEQYHAQREKVVFVPV
jgi:hypothetical protein